MNLICCVVCDLQMVDCGFQIKSAHDAFFHSFQDKLSPFLRFGCLSPRTVYHALSEVYQNVGVLILGESHHTRFFVLVIEVQYI